MWSEGGGEGGDGQTPSFQDPHLKQRLKRGRFPFTQKWHHFSPLPSLPPPPPLLLERGLQAWTLSATSWHSGLAQVQSPQDSQQLPETHSSLQLWQ